MSPPTSSVSAGSPLESPSNSSPSSAATTLGPARKRFGQHFLVDRAIIEQILTALAPQPLDRIVEIGPGRGALTWPLLARLEHLQAIELDRDLVAWWRSQPRATNLELHSADVLNFDFTALGHGLRLVGNLPYNISTPLLFKLWERPALLRDAHFMLQKEVVDRLVATPGTSAYGRLAVALQLRFELEMILEVSPHAFTPPPRVDSAVVRLLPKSPAQRLELWQGSLTIPPTAPFSAPGLNQRLVVGTSELGASRPQTQQMAALEQWELRLIALVAQAFTQRRKMLRSTLAGAFTPTALNALGIAPQRRAETLTLAEFARLTSAKSVDSNFPVLGEE